MTKPLTGYEKEIAILHAEALLDFELIQEFKGEAYEYKQAIERVRELHYKYDAGCSCCDSAQYECAHCLTDYPCPTIKELDGEK